jgi:hypothetical protein
VFRRGDSGQIEKPFKFRSNGASARYVRAADFVAQPGGDLLDI